MTCVTLEIEKKGPAGLLYLNRPQAFIAISA